MPDSTVYPSRPATVQPDNASTIDTGGSSVSGSIITTSTDVMDVGLPGTGIQGVTTSAGSLV
jgi:hypothetical protein